MKLLFHCCCGPCAAACVESLAAESITPTLLWYNPNIHPFTEYKNRYDALAHFTAVKNMQLEANDAYGLITFLQSIGKDMEAPNRCEICYRLRLEWSALQAKERGFDAFSTSLLASPYQQHGTIRLIGEEIAEQYGVGFLYRDFRSFFRQGQSQAHTLGLYMQKYCGCIFSEAERYAKKASSLCAAP